MPNNAKLGQTDDVEECYSCASPPREKEERLYEQIGDWLLLAPYRRGKIYYVRARRASGGKYLTYSTRETSLRLAWKKGRTWVQGLTNPEEKILIGFKQAYEEFLKTKIDIGPRTKAIYDSEYRMCFTPAFGDRYVQEITLSDIERYIQTAKSAKGKISKGGKPLAPSTIRQHMIRLKEFFRWALLHQYCTKDPTLGAKLPKVKPNEKQALSLDQMRALLEACRTPVVIHTKADRRRPEGWNRPISSPDNLFPTVLAGLWTGLRRSNLTKLRWSQIELTTRRISIPGSEMKNGRPLDLPIHPELLAILEGLLRGKDAVNVDEPVFGFEVRSRNGSDFSRSLATAAKRAKIPFEVTPHTLRHTFSTYLADKVPYAVRQSLLGHYAKRTVTDQYTHISFDTLQEWLDKLPHFLPPTAITKTSAEPSTAKARA